ncbi:tryptophan 2,3-dioxygenase family protein [Actinokineospora pegani]|uniref:tryptophan 2,3-dioxygenase family protein n=1 Tax=Actinokineospora pegani TaxID=2654637 RepID=UPI0018D2A4DB|nr:tryptophan 2,3-dioxygenase family protein [Actinokineospora pegani]
MSAPTYASYLHLDELLSLQRPFSPPDDVDLHDAERLFIVVHQASEVLLGQALTDLRRIAGPGGAESAGHRADRATWVVHTLVGNVGLLREALRPRDFLGFRDLFGSASGLQSTQFQELFRLTDRFAAAGLPDRARAERLRAAVVAWREAHLELVRHTIGDHPGSGDTSGIDFLRRRLTASARGKAVAAPGCPVGANH